MLLTILFIFSLGSPLDAELSEKGMRVPTIERPITPGLSESYRNMTPEKKLSAIRAYWDYHNRVIVPQFEEARKKALERRNRYKAIKNKQLPPVL